MKKDKDWWDEFYPAFRPMFGKIPHKITNAEVKFIVNKMNLKSGSRFLDCPCGIGRIALPLAKAGIKVTGVDITKSYLTELSGNAKKRGFKIDLHRADMRRIKFDSEFDAGANLWTSFGYFEKESDNLLVLKRMFKALKPGGKFLLHVVNRDWIMANFSSSGWREVKGARLLIKRRFDYVTSTNYETWIIYTGDGEACYQTRIRNYSYHELRGMFEKAGFVDIEGYGTVNEEPVSRDHSMMFIFGSRPRR